MPQSPLEDVVTHWHKLVENFHTSPLEFYAAVEDALRRRKLPDLGTVRVDWDEGGILAPRRQYLRVFGEHHVFDMCAAPFGSGFFFSAWVTKQKARLVPLYYGLFMLGVVLTAWSIGWFMRTAWREGGLLDSVIRFILGSPFVLWPLAVLVVMGTVGLMARAGNYDPERAMLTVPLVGWFYQKVFAPETYYRLDTMYMFQSAVQSAMQEVINGQLTAKGLRALNEGEFKPVEKQLVDRRHTVPDETLTAMANAN